MARATVTVYLEGLDRHKTLKKLRARVEDPSRALRAMGELLIERARDAFRNQRLGNIRWPARYEGRGQPHVNVAGVVADFLEGRSRPKPRRFFDRPAGIDSGETLRKLTPRLISVQGKTLRLNAPTPQAKKMQSENDADRTSVQPVTKGVKDRLNEWSKMGRRRSKRNRRTSTPMRADDTAAKRLGFLFRRSTIRTRSARRPFFGIDEATADLCRKILGGHLLPPGVPGAVR